MNVVVVVKGGMVRQVFFHQLRRERGGTGPGLPGVVTEEEQFDFDAKEKQVRGDGAVSRLDFRYGR